MSWAIGFDEKWNRDIGYGVPAVCDHPDCSEEIDRGLGYVCGGDPYGGQHGCGLFFCGEHLYYKEFDGDDNGAFVCDNCHDAEPPFEPKPDVKQWIEWKLTDESWARWRAENSEEVQRLLQAVGA